MMEPLDNKNAVSQYKIQNCFTHILPSALVG